MKRLCLAFVGIVAFAGVAAAADLGARPPQPYYPKAAVVVPPYSWTGAYVGINGGGAFGSSNWDSNGSRNVSGGLIGGTIGYNYQAGPAVWGIEGDIDWTDINGSASSTACPPGCKTSNTWLSTVRGRLGYAADRFMPFVTGGAAFGNIETSAPGLSGPSSNQIGWTLGGGIEAALVNNWSAKVEYLYVDLGHFNCGITCGAVTDNVSFHTNVLRAGINYKFW